MDKNTLSNYGWIVVLILVLSVLLALATPFGRFVADGFEATYTGFAHVANGEDGNKILQAAGMSSNTNNTPSQTDREIYRFTQNFGTGTYGYIFFAVMESEPDKAYVGGFSPSVENENSGDAWNGLMPYSDNCNCTPNDSGLNFENAKGCSYDINTKTVVCPCGATTIQCDEFQDFTCEHTNRNFFVNYFTANTHELVCQDCNNWIAPVIEPHTDENADGACDVCGYTDPSVCAHTKGQYWNMKNGTHNFNCDTCKTYQEGLICNMVDGKCSICGYTDPANCSHINANGINNWDGTHNVECSDCGTLIAENQAHNDTNGDGSCDACWEYLGGEIVGGGCQHNSGNSWIANQQDGTHATVCGDCFTALSETKEAHYDNDIDGTCDVCGACITHIDNDNDGLCDRDVVPMN